MITQSLPARLAFFALGNILSLSPNAHCQESSVVIQEEKSTILLRVICKQPVAGATDLQIVQGDGVIHELKVTDSLMTDPLAVGRGQLLLSRASAGTDEAMPAPIMEVTIPKHGNRFVLALFSSSKPTPGKPYEHRLVRTDGIRFQSSDIYLFNLTNIDIGGRVGKRNFTLEPDSSTIVTPVPEKSGSRMYQSRFYCGIGGQVRMFNDTRWPVSKSARVYLFFIPDPARQSIGYLSFREYEPFP